MATQRKQCLPNLSIDAKTSCYYSIQPLVVSESALTPSSLNVTTPQDTVNLASSCLPPANLVPSHSQIPVSTRVYRGAEPSQAPLLFQHGPDFNSQAEDIFSLTNNPCQSYGRYDPSYYFLPPSSSTGSLSIEQDVEPYQHWVDPNTQYFIPQPILPYVSNASSTFPGHSNSDNDIYAEFTGSPHLTMTSTNDGTPLPLAFPNYDANNLHSYYK